MCIYIYIYVCMYVCMYVCIFAIKRSTLEIQIFYIIIKSNDIIDTNIQLYFERNRLMKYFPGKTKTKIRYDLLYPD